MGSIGDKGLFPSGLDRFCSLYEMNKLLYRKIKNEYIRKSSCAIDYAGGFLFFESGHFANKQGVSL